jgi:hypothetical protein
LLTRSSSRSHLCNLDESRAEPFKVPLEAFSW